MARHDPVNAKRIGRRETPATSTPRRRSTSPSDNGVLNGVTPSSPYMAGPGDRDIAQRRSRRRRQADGEQDAPSLRPARIRRPSAVGGTETPWRRRFAALRRRTCCSRRSRMRRRHQWLPSAGSSRLVRTAQMATRQERVWGRALGLPAGVQRDLAVRPSPCSLKHSSRAASSSCCARGCGRAGGHARVRSGPRSRRAPAPSRS